MVIMVDNSQVMQMLVDKIEEIALTDQYESITATVQENIVDNNKIDFVISIDELKKEYIERINIVGNNVTREEVFRNALIIDEGDTFNEIFHNKSINNLKSLNFFRRLYEQLGIGESNG